MTEKQLKQVEAQLPENERLYKMYRAVEGDIRIISKNKSGEEIRYTVSFDTESNASIKRF